jgi:hypothetical protein
MPQAKFSKVFDYRAKSGSITAYPAGYEGDIPQAHFDAAATAGALEGEAPAKDAGGSKSK